ncbi:MAG: hypothetical protein RL160_1738 [Bacteroidota bacterium]|jgi:sensor histidine kinase YesM
MNLDYFHIILLSTLFILVLLSLTSHYILVKALKHQELLRADLRSKLLRKRLDPHFIGNLLQSLVGLFYRGKKEQIGTVIQEYASLVKHNFEVLELDNISLEEEVKFLLRYLYTRNLMSEVQIHYELRLSIYTPTQELYVPAMLLQPILENALNHGLHGNKAPHIILEFKITENLRVRIIDNGPGMNVGAMDKSKGSLNLTIERLKLLNKMSTESFSFQFLDDLSEYGITQGCGVELNLPILKEL